MGKYLLIFITLFFSSHSIAEDTCDSYDIPKYFEYVFDDEVGFAVPKISITHNENIFETRRDDSSDGLVVFRESNHEYFNYRTPKVLLIGRQSIQFAGDFTPYKYKIHAYAEIDDIENEKNLINYGFYNLGIDSAVAMGSKYGGRQSYRLFSGNLTDSIDGIHYNASTGYLTGMIYDQESFSKESNFEGVEYSYGSHEYDTFLEAGIYIGAYKDEKKHGKGVLIFPYDGFILEDEFENDEHLSIYNINSKEGLLNYFEELKSKYSNNYVRLEYDDDSEYTHYIGETLNATPNGIGILYHRNGYLVGQFENGTLNGFGFEHITQEEGEWMIIGDYKDGSPTYGQLRQWDDNGLTQYWGDFGVNDMGERLRHGYGTLTYGNYDFSEQIIYSGEFIDHYHTVGTMIWPDGSSYHGEFLNGQRDGYGVFTTDDLIYDGYFKNGLEQGKGIIVDWNNYKIFKVESCFGEQISKVLWIDMD